MPQSNRLPVRPKRSCLVSGNWPDENFFITHPITQSNVYQNISFHFKKQRNKKKNNNNKKKQKRKQEYKKAKETREKNRISPENRISPLKQVNLWLPGWRFFSSTAFPETRVFSCHNTYQAENMLQSYQLLVK